MQLAIYEETKMKKRTKILLVDDEPEILRLTGGKLTREGFEVLYAHDGNEGREMARRIKVDLILLDIRMPIMDGIETLQRLKSEEITKDIPVIMLTSEDLSMEAEDLMIKDAGAEAYVQKGQPFDILVESINKALKSHKDKSIEPKS